jgi:hypothetical protein
VAYFLENVTIYGMEIIQKTQENSIDFPVNSSELIFTLQIQIEKQSCEIEELKKQV